MKPSTVFSLFIADLSIRISAIVKGFRCRLLEGERRIFGGRRPKAFAKTELGTRAKMINRRGRNRWRTAAQRPGLSRKVASHLY